MAKIITVTASDGTTVRFFDEVKAQGGVKDVMFSPDKSYVVAFYREKATAATRERLLEITGRYRENRPGYPAIAISDVSHLSCVSNDFGYEYVFSRYVESVGRAGDVLLGISTSGNSGNVIKAIEAARAQGMKVITLTGKDGGKMAGSADVEIRVPHFGYADRIQEIHIKVIHILIMLIEKEMVKA